IVIPVVPRLRLHHWWTVTHFRKSCGIVHQCWTRRCGSAGDNCRKYYLVIDKVKYRFESATKAFDTLFKSYHALHASYPAAAAHLIY
ncbi:unnamed protein product, partial [Trichogramma brassicae]